MRKILLMAVFIAGFGTLCGANAPDAEKIAAVKKGELKEARASWWGFDPVDSTGILQAALDSRVPRLIIDKQNSPWIVRPLKAYGNMEIIFEDGAEIVAKRGEFKPLYDSLFTLEKADNVIIRGLGSGGILRMYKKDYLDRKQYKHGEWRHCLNVIEAKNLHIENMKFFSSGGDGIYLRTVDNVVVRNVLCDDNSRQGCSIIGGHNVLIENSVFSNTRGTSPQSGLDIEPNYPEEPLSGFVVRNCKFINNFRWGILVAATRQNSDRAGNINIKFENCIAENNREGDIYAYTRTEFKTGDPIRGKIEFINCQAVSDRQDPFVRPPVEVDLDLHHQLQVYFKNLLVKRGKNTSKAVQINFNHPLSANSAPQGKIIFDDLKLADVTAKDAFQINDYSFSGTSGWISGTVTDSTGKKQQITAEVLKKSGQQSEKEYGFDYTNKTFSATGYGDGKSETYPEFPFILSADYWLLAKAGEQVNFTLKYTKNGRWSRDPAQVTLIAPDGSRTPLGSVAPAGENTFAFTAKSAGIYKAEVRGFYLKTALIASNVPAGPIAKDFETELDRVTGSLYFFVPAGTPEFAVRVWGRGFVNSVGVQLTDPQGSVVYNNPFVCGGGVQYNVSGANVRNGIWKITFSKPRRYWYDRCFFRLMGVPQYLGLRPDRMLECK
ncbi:MAG: right-handed parallel beta-helix repeat-containing protein [Lentisphaeria bacterium]|nr:right-handed parallel beta-helix repeat-containing protein [Lentisphaeria bacterium]